MRYLKNHRIALAALALCASAGSAGAQAEYRERIDTTVTLERGGTLSVSMYAGRVNVTGTSGSQVRIRGMVDRNDLTIRARPSSVSLSMEPGGHRGGGAELDITVPIGTRVVLEGFSTPFSVRGVKGEANVQSMSGSVMVNDAVGNVNVETVSGRIEVTGVKGDLSAESVSGRLTMSEIDGDITTESVSGAISIARANARTVRAESVNGSVIYDGSIDPSGNYAFTTHSGNLTLVVPVNAGATVTLETFSGTVDSDFPVTMESGTSRRGHESKFEFRIGDGRSRIVLETFSGDIKIQRGSGRANQE